MLDIWALLDEAASETAAVQTAVRRHLHRHPETSGREVATTRLVADRLAAAGLEPNIMADGLGLTADLTLGDCPPDRPAVLLRADIDALPIQDEKAVEYRSCAPGAMHACGHDGHTAIVLGAALATASLRDRWRQGDAPPMRLRFLFQPAEETAAGAASMIAQGVLENVGAALAVHMEPHYPVGHAGVRYGVLTAASDELHIAITGHAGHAARPHLTRDPVLAAAQLVVALYAAAPRRVDARSPAVLTIARIAAGHAHNAVPDRASLAGTLRTIDPETRETLLERVTETCSGIAAITGTAIVPEVRRSLPSVVNDARAAAALEAAAGTVLGADHVIRIEQPSMGGEDFAFYTHHVPGAMLRLGCTAPGLTPQHLHSSRFDFDERALPLGSRILLRAAAGLSRSLF